MTGSLAIGAGIKNHFTLLSQIIQVAAEQLIDTVIKSHHIDRCLYFALLHPEAGKAGHAGHLAGIAVVEIQVPEVIDVQAGIQLLKGDEVFVNQYSNKQGRVKLEISPKTQGTMYYSVEDGLGNAILGQVEVKFAEN